MDDENVSHQVYLDIIYQAREYVYMMTPYLVSKLRRYVRGPLLCKPNAGNPVIGSDGFAAYAMTSDEFSRILSQCIHNGATLIGGCCGTTPEFIRQLAHHI